MKILALSDVESKFLWDYFDKDYFKDIDLILSCGDLEAEYLSFLATMCKAPVVYVPGNHDSSYLTKPPEGCICADDTLLTIKGLKIAGLGGCLRYNNSHYQYTEAEMAKRVRALGMETFFRRGVDIFLTHAPAKGYGDDTDLPHQGFQCFTTYIDRFKPQLMVHGHVHMSYGTHIAREIQRGDTRIINAYEKYIIEI